MLKFIDEEFRLFLSRYITSPLLEKKQINPTGHVSVATITMLRLNLYLALLGYLASPFEAIGPLYSTVAAC
jgi:hypothetical protein